MAAYTIKTMKLTGDASGGDVKLSVNMDPRFCAIVAFMSVQIAQGTAADADARFLVRGNTYPSLVETLTLNSVVSLVSSFEVGHTFVPPPVVLAGGNAEGASMEVSFKNVLNDDFFLDAMIYLFNIQVREATGMGPLLWARGSN